MPDPRLRLHPWAQDVVLAVVVAGLQVQGTATRADRNAETVLRPLADLGDLGYALLVVSGLVLAVRRRWPVAVFAVTALGSAVYYTLDYPDAPGWIGLFVATYTLTARGDGRRSVLIAGVGISILAVVWLVAAADIEPRAALGWVFFRIGASVMSAALGESVRSRQVIASDALARAELAERTREEEARARVDAERLRIAREVHDTVAHAIAIINVQAGVTAHVLDRRPDQARATLEAIEQTSGRALQEMRTILGVLRDEREDRVPHPGLGQLGELAARTREAGLDVELAAAPPASAIPSAVGSAVYRIVQEALTNVVRHVGPTRVTIAIDADADAVGVRVVDEGSPAGRPTPRADGAGGSGRGLVGMRERCQLLGGDLDAHPTPTGGFEVRARLPLAPVGPGTS
ncbi:sensor histidine kinase [Nocardioides sp.]|uniref:sensor histidine kinase n=1 Tax=Nocardioides sp. TaxID=35761 RepID=UPI002ED7C3D2